MNETAEIKMECLKLAQYTVKERSVPTEGNRWVSEEKDPQRIITMAKIFEGYVTGEKAEPDKIDKVIEKLANVAEQLAARTA